jgi:hypothetical protein
MRSASNRRWGECAASARRVMEALCLMRARGDTGSVALRVHMGRRNGSMQCYVRRARIAHRYVRDLDGRRGWGGALWWGR